MTRSTVQITSMRHGDMTKTGELVREPLGRVVRIQTARIGKHPYPRRAEQETLLTYLSPRLPKCRPEGRRAKIDQL
jgi:hypothetical protein